MEYQRMNSIYGGSQPKSIPINISSNSMSTNSSPTNTELSSSPQRFAVHDKSFTILERSKFSSYLQQKYPNFKKF